MDFVSGFPITQRKHDSVWVIVDRLTKSAHFLPVQFDYSMDRLTELYVNEIVRLRGIPLSIVFDCDPQFTSRFWKELQLPFHHWNRLAKSSHHVKLRRIPRQSEFHVFQGNGGSVGHLAHFEGLKRCYMSCAELVKH